MERGDEREDSSQVDGGSCKKVQRRWHKTAGSEEKKDEGWWKRRPSLLLKEGQAGCVKSRDVEKARCEMFPQPSQQFLSSLGGKGKVQAGFFFPSLSSFSLFLLHFPIYRLCAVCWERVDIWAQYLNSVSILA